MCHPLRKFLAVFVFAAWASHLTPAAAAGLVPHEGFVQVPGGPVWYRVFSGQSNVMRPDTIAASCNY